MPENNSILTRFKSWMNKSGWQLIFSITFVLFLRTSIAEPFKIPSGSMIPTLFIGDFIFVNKAAYGFKMPFSEYFLENPIYLTQMKLPARGDVIVFKYPRDPSLNYIKRVVGLPGDIIQIHEKILYINNKAIDTVPYQNADLSEGIESDVDKKYLSLFTENLMGVNHSVLYQTIDPPNLEYGPVEIPQGKLLCMGDNRDRSSDSRFWGFVPQENIKGKALFVWMSLLLSWENEFKFKFQWKRLGTLVR